MDRKIIHCDADCFYAAVECLDNPHLKGKPIAVGGSSDRRGVIATCSYEARAFGVRSAMATAHAKRLCPELLVIPGRMNRYKEISQQIHQIFQQFTPLIEPLSLDEAYLDVTDQTTFGGSATLMANAIREQIHSSVGITVSAGVAPNKFLAKIASDWRKPNGQFVITPKQVADFIVQLPVEKLHGVGKVTQRKLHEAGIYTCRDIQQHSVFDLTQRFGSFGEYLYRLAHGIDDRPVGVRGSRKSVSVEHTFAADLPNVEACIDALPDLEIRLQQRLERLTKKSTIKKAFVKVKFSDFTSTTMECCIQEPRIDTYQSLCKEAYQRGNRGVRLLGVGVRFEETETSLLNQQLTLAL